METPCLVVRAILWVFVPDKSTIACAALDRLHCYVSGHEWFGVWPELWTETVGKYEAPFGFHKEDAAFLLGKDLPFRRLHHDIEYPARH
jgi:hypothetical protein